ncbi:TonB-dependent receptor [Chitinophaga horti]|uniref:TonB-dependent receptor n=1 Tax=Chitinophaga horti TaxID=2920382 RepID=A0ABY6IXD6_9BACT|nr:TonB-dependent receptor [Chitinophaga horti]UYQ92052.1 TonB-dependent receptor [Chitinophaga horti]
MLLLYFPLQSWAWNWRTRVSLSVKQQPLSEVCRQLGKTYGIQFSYSRDVVRMSQMVDVDVRNVSLKRLMELVFDENGVEYKRIGEQIVLTAKKKEQRTISGYAEDAITGEKLIGVTVYSPLLQVGTVSNQYGFYSLTTKRDTLTLIATYIGYEPVMISLKDKSSRQLKVQLKPSNTLKQVEVTESAPKLQDQTQMSRISIPLSQVKTMPKLLGEEDVLRTMMAMPGVSGGRDGVSGMNVRGGSPEQNLVLLDGTPVYNPSHLFGIYSVFHPDLVKNVELYKGAFPARYGGRLSSVTDVSLKDGDMHKYRWEASAGLLSGKFIVEGPIWKNKTSFVLTGRRSLADLYMQPFVEKNLDVGDNGEFGVMFYDANIKINHIFSPRDRLFISAYGGQDNMKLLTDKEYNDSFGDKSYQEMLNFRLGWGNQIYSLRWNHLYNPRLFSNLTASFSQYFFLTDYRYKYESFRVPEKDNLFGKYYSRTQNGSLKLDYDYRPHPNHVVRFGLQGAYHIFEPGITQFSSQENDVYDTAYNKEKPGGLELSMYAEDDWRISDSLHLNLGLHISAFMIFPEWYRSVQPRLGFRYMLPRNWAMKWTYTKMVQYIHLLSNNSTYLPTDLWVPVTDKVRPMISNQVALGLAKTSKDKQYELSLEAYYKTMQNVIEYEEQAGNFQSATKSWDEKVVIGQGSSYGFELLAQKKAGRTQATVGYTLSRSRRSFPNINNGKIFPYKYDHLHDLELMLSHRFEKNWELSANWMYMSGMPLTLASASYEPAPGSSPYDPPLLPGSGQVDYVGDRNTLRTMDQHRLDLSVSYNWQRKKFDYSMNMSVYNVYNRKNPFYYYYKYDENMGRRDLTQFTLLPVLPSLTFSIRAK